MTTTPILGITQVAPNQTGKETVINTAILALEAATNGTASIPVTTANVTLSQSQFLGSILFVVTGLTADRTLNIPTQINGVNTKRVFAVRNISAFNLTVKVNGSSGTTVILPANTTRLMDVDGAGNIGVLAQTPTLVAPFTALTDVPTSYTGQANKLVKVKGTEDGLQFTTISFSYLTDVAITTPLDGQVLTYNTAASKWLNQALPAAYTDEKAQDAIAAMLTADNGITLVYDDVGNIESIRSSRFMIPFWFGIPPTTSEILGLYIATDAFTFSANFGGSKGVTLVLPTATFVITVARQINATGGFTTIGTISIDTAGVVTFATSTGSAVTIAANDVIKLTAPVTVDTTVANSTFNLRGY